MCAMGRQWSCSYPAKRILVDRAIPLVDPDASRARDLAVALDVALDEGGRLIGPDDRRIEAGVDEALAHFAALHDAHDLVAKPRDDVAWRAGRRAVPGPATNVEAGQPRCFGEWRQFGQ